MALTAIRESIVVRVPVPVAYGQWTRFEEFPRFMEGVTEVRQLDDRNLHWEAEVAGRRASWDAEIVEQQPDTRIAWRSTGGTQNEGEVSFEPVDEGNTRVAVVMVHEEEGLAERAGDALGLAERRVRRDLERFKDLVESTGGDPDGGWRGEIHGGEVRNGDEGAGIGPERYPEATRLPSLGRLRGMEARTTEGEKVGTVKDVYLDAEARHARYLAVKTGRLSGTHVVPVDDVTYVDEGRDSFVVVPYTAQHLKGAPTVGDDDELTPERERAIYDHYERVGYWDDAREVVRARQTEPAPTPEIAEAEVADAIDRGEDPNQVAVKRWGV
jgi:sporulation protein YlmC with PRC-barrel domain